MEEQERVWTHEKWPAICPSCGERRTLWPLNQNVSSLDDPKCQFVHIQGGKEECNQ